MNNFSDNVLEWFKSHGRRDLPWQKNPTPYRVWVSEIMLQQTQVATVIPYYQSFMKKFPSIAELAKADIDQVLHLWTGLGYYARARNLHKAAQTVVEKFSSEFPKSVEALESLPGIGRSTAGAIAALSMNIQAPILDGNVKRVLARFHTIEGWPEQTKVKNALWQIAEQYTPVKDVAEYTQAIMDLGATVCKRSNPGCDRCPLYSNCLAFTTNSIKKYPGKKPKKKLPVKSVVMYIFQNESGEVYLEKRPPNGIWGSLYSFPEQALEADTTLAHESIENIPQHILPLKSGKSLQPLRHTFSHYHLDINPRMVAVKQNGVGVAETDHWLWYPLDHSVEVGLAAPVKKLLSKLAVPL